MDRYKSMKTILFISFIFSIFFTIFSGYKMIHFSIVAASYPVTKYNRYKGKAFFFTCMFAIFCIETFALYEMVVISNVIFLY